MAFFFYIMPWKVFQDGTQHCVHKLNADGSMGARVACHGSASEAESQVRALYASENMTSTYLLEEFVTPRPGEAYRLFPFGVIYKGGKKREITRELAIQFRLPHFKPPIKLGSHKEETPAGGHIARLEVREDGLYAIPELIETGAQAIKDGAYRYHSPEVIFEGGLEDPNTGQLIPAPLIVGDALLHTPHLGESTALYSVEPITKGESNMTQETVTIPVSLWERFTAWLDRKEEKPDAQPPEPPQTNTEQYDALTKQVEEYKAKVEELETQKARQAEYTAIAGGFQTEEFGAAYKSLDTQANVEMLATMTAPQREWVTTQFKALSAQIEESNLTGNVGAHDGTNGDPVQALDLAVKAHMAEKSVDYNVAFDAVRTSQPELFAAYIASR